MARSPTLSPSRSTVCLTATWPWAADSSIDTAKVANLFATYPADLLTYVNPPIGLGKPVPGPVKPLIAIPTTAGTGSETTGVAIFDYTAMHAKTGIAHRALKPDLGILDPDNTRSMPPMVAASSGLDVLSHALESLTAIPFDRRPAADSPAMRPAYQGANPISDIWSAQAIRMVAANIVAASTDPDDDEARGQMLLASAYAGIGFGNAGVHLPHGMSYPVSGMVRDFVPDGYPGDHPIIPHGMSVILNAPAVFRFTAAVNPQRHLYGAELMGVDIGDVADDDAGEVLAAALDRCHEAVGRAQRVGGHRFWAGRRGSTGRGHASATPRHQALAAARPCRRSAGDVYGCDGLLVWVAGILNNQPRLCPDSRTDQPAPSAAQEYAAPPAGSYTPAVSNRPALHPRETGPAFRSQW